MLESKAVADLEVGQVDPRMAAEEISLGFLECVLKGLQRSPRTIQDAAESAAHHGVLTIEDVSCLVTPEAWCALCQTPTPLSGPEAPAG